MTLLVLPLAIPFAAAVAAFVLRSRPRAARGVSVAAAVALAAATAALFVEVRRAGPLAATMGGWPAPFGITLVADALSATMLLIAGLAGLVCALYGLADVGEAEERRGHAALCNMLLGGVCGAFLTADLFNLYVWFEVTLISSFGLIVLRGGATQIDGAVKYAALNLVATVAMLLAIGLLYGATGTLNMADLRGAVAGRFDEAAVATPAALLLFAFGVKAGFFPLFFWLPASYHAPSVTVSALFSALLTKMAVYALYRVFTLIYPLGEIPEARLALLWVGCATMVIGVIGAAAQNEVRRILSFHIVSQIGYMALGLALWSPVAIAGGLFYMWHNIAAKTNLFLTGGLAARLAGSERLAEMGGLWSARPWFSMLFLVSALSMAGVPPFSGFWAKFFLVRESLNLGQYLEAGLALGVGLLTLYSMTKIWGEAFWKPAPEGRAPDAAAPAPMLWPAAAMTGVIIAIGLAVGPVWSLAREAAAGLVDPSAYVAAVLGTDGEDAP